MTLLLTWWVYMIFNELSNNQKKFIKSLKQSKSFRYKNKRFFIEGFRSVCEALNSDYKIDYIVVSKPFLNRFGDDFNQQVVSIRPDVKIFQATRQIYDEISDTVTPQGIMAVVEMKSFSNYTFLKKDFLIVALDMLADPGNMGTVIRTADAAAADAVIAGKGCVDVYNSKVLRSTMGSIFHLPIILSDDLVSTLLYLKGQGGKVVTTHLDANRYYSEIDLTGPTILVMGKEDEGVSKEVSDISDESIKIPMPGNAESLNVSVASGVILFEAVRQRMRKSL
jgi:TrmH family RNA methyltransferase